MRKVAFFGWSRKIAYCVGLITSDGSLSISGRHVDFSSKDLELIEKISLILGVKNKCSIKKSGSGSYCYRVQISNVYFYRFLLSVGLIPNKSKQLSGLTIPHDYFFHFLRGCIDGDGNINVYFSKNSRLPQLKIKLSSGSYEFLKWVMTQIQALTLIKDGWIQHEKSVYTLVYGKKSGIILLKEIYKKSYPWYLTRKKDIANQFLL